MKKLKLGWKVKLLDITSYGYDMIGKEATVIQVDETDGSFLVSAVRHKPLRKDASVMAPQDNEAWVKNKDLYIILLFEDYAKKLKRHIRGRLSKGKRL